MSRTLAFSSDAPPLIAVRSSRFPGNVQVGGARCRVTARMIVGDHQRRRAREDRTAEDSRQETKVESTVPNVISCRPKG
jgi:hypothetical protein